ncbi:MAG: TetR/AcrR family transcriptional regulator [Gemmatimonadota bacterium]
MNASPGPGRPRSEAARQAILAAALELAQQDGYQAVTIKGIAERAGVGRQTVYRWWQTKAEVLLEAVTEFVAAQAQPEPSGDALADVREFLRATFAQSQPLGPVIAGLMADAIADPGFSARVRDRLLTRRRAALRGLLEAGQASGQLPADYPVDLAIDLVFGVLSYRILSGDATGDAALADEIAGALRRLGSREQAGPG